MDSTSTQIIFFLKLGIVNVEEFELFSSCKILTKYKMLTKYKILKNTKYWPNTKYCKILTPPRPRTPLPRPQRARETPRSCTGDHFSRLVFIEEEDAVLNFLARRTRSISCWWLVSCGEAENALKIGKRGHFNSAAARKRVDLRTLFDKDSKFKLCWENMKVVPTQESSAWLVERWRISFAKRFQDGSAGHSGRN